MFEVIRSWAELVAVGVGALIAIGAIFTQLINGIEATLTRRARKRNSRSTRNLLIIPEPEEVAKYGVKLIQDTRREEAEHIINEEYAASRVRQWRIEKRFSYNHSLTIRAQSRILASAIVLAAGFFLLWLRFVVIAMTE